MVQVVRSGSWGSMEGGGVYVSLGRGRVKEVKARAAAEDSLTLEPLLRQGTQGGGR